MNSEELANRIREQCLRLSFKHKTSHVGGSLSIADVLAVLYENILNYDVRNCGWAERDRLFYSKGHACMALYSVLEKKGFFSNLFEDFTKDGTYFTSHVNHHIPGVELSTGSLGHALGVAVGTALAGSLAKMAWKTFVILSDGELDEGSNWEAILFAPHHKLTNLCIIIDYNKIQSFGSVSEVLDLAPLGDKFRSFRWNCVEIDGHDHNQLKKVFTEFKNNDTTGPLAVICNTVKGKGVSFMENQLAWHYKSPNEDQLKAGLKELGIYA